MTPAALKLEGDHVTVIFTKPCCLSSFKRVFADNSKCSIIVKLLYEGHYRILRNSVLYIISKVFESIVSTTQYRFQQTHSYSSCQLDYFYGILKLKDSGNFTIVVNFDFLTAFDEVSYTLLLSKMLSYVSRCFFLFGLQHVLVSRSQNVLISHADVC